MGTKIEFGHAVLTDNPADLRLIRTDPNINFVRMPVILTEATKEYLDLLEGSAFAHVPFYRDRDGNIRHIQVITRDVLLDMNALPSVTDFIQTRLQLMPFGEKLPAFVEAMIEQAQIFAKAASAEKITFDLYINHPDKRSGWHADGDTDLRSLITWTGDHSSLWRPNHTVTDWSELYGRNNFGANGEAKPEEIYHGEYHIVPIRHHGIWKGRKHERNALIHAEAFSPQATKPRLIQVMNTEPS